MRITETAAETTSPTVLQYGNLSMAYDYFNRTLFNGELAECMIVTEASTPRCLGHFCPESWQGADGKSVCHEINLSQRHLDRPLIAVFGTLVHEMAHLWQQDFGKPSKNGYHNKEWGGKMKQLGLHPSNTGEVGGKECGQSMTHYIVEGGAFSEACGGIPDDITLPWVHAPRKLREKKPPTRIKYTCACGNAAWAKRECNLVCGDCSENMLGEED